MKNMHQEAKAQYFIKSDNVHTVSLTHPFDKKANDHLSPISVLFSVVALYLSGKRAEMLSGTYPISSRTNFPPLATNPIFQTELFTVSEQPCTCIYHNIDFHPMFLL